MAACLRNASCRCSDCVMAMGMLTAKDLENIASSNIHDEAMTETVTTDEKNEKPFISNDVREQVEENYIAPINAELKEVDDFNEMPLNDLLQHKNWKARKVGYSKITTVDFNLEVLNILVNEKSLAIMELALKTCSKNLGSVPVDEIDVLAILKLLVAKAYTAKTSVKMAAFELTDLLCEKGGEQVYKETVVFLCNCCLKKIEKLRISPKGIECTIQCLHMLLENYGLLYFDNSFSLLVKEVVLMGMSQRQVTIRRESTKLAILVNSFLRGSFAVILNQEDSSKYKFKSAKQSEETLKSLEDGLDKALRPKKTFKSNLSKDTGDDQIKELEEENDEDIDPYQYLPEKSLMPNLEAFFKNIQAQKWSQRKDAYNELIKAAGNPGAVKLSAKDNYSELFHEIRKTLSSDSNLNVNMASITLCTTILSGLRKGFFKYFASIIDLIIVKLKDKKLLVDKTVGNFLDEYARHLFDFSSNNEKGIRSTLGVLLKCNQRSLPSLQRVRILKWLERLTLLKGKLSLDEQSCQSNMEYFVKALSESLKDHEKEVRKQAVVVLEKLLNPGVPCFSLESEKTQTFLKELEKLRLENGKLFSNSLKSSPSSATSNKNNINSKRSASQKKLSKPVSESRKPSGKYEVSNISVVVDSFESSFPNEFLPVFKKHKNATCWQDKKHLYELILQTLEGDIIATLPKNEQYVDLLLYASNGFKERNFNLLNYCWSILKSLAIHKLKENETEILEAVLSPVVLNITDKKQSELSRECLLELSSLFHPKYVCEYVSNVAKTEKKASFKVHLCVLTALETILLNFGVLNCNIEVAAEAALVYGYADKKANRLVKQKADILLRLLLETCGIKLLSFATPESSNLLESLNIFDKYPVVSNINTKFRNIRHTSRDELRIDMDSVEVRKFDVSDFLQKEEILLDLRDMAWKIRFKAINSFNDMLESRGNAITFSGEPAQFKELVKIMKARLSESNKNLVGKSLQILGNLSPVVHENSKRQKYFLKVVSPVVLPLLNDNKRFVVDAVITTCKGWFISSTAIEYVVNANVGSLCNLRANVELFLNLLSEMLVSLKKLRFTEDFPPALYNIILCHLQSKFEKVRTSAIKLLQVSLNFMDAEVVQDVVRDFMRTLRPEGRKRLNDILQPMLDSKKSKQVGKERETSFEKKTIQKVTEAETKRPNPDSSLKVIEEPKNIKSTTFKQRKLELGMKSRKRRENCDIKTKWPFSIETRDRESLLQELRVEFKRSSSIPSDTLSLQAFLSCEPDRILLELNTLNDYILQEENANTILVIFDLLCKVSTIYLNIANSAFTNSLLTFLQRLLNLEIKTWSCVNQATCIVLIPHLLQKSADKQKRFRDKSKELLRLVSNFDKDGSYLKVCVEYLNKNTRGRKMNNSFVIAVLEILSEFEFEAASKKQLIPLCKRVVPLVSLANGTMEVKEFSFRIMEKIFESLNFSKRALIDIFSSCDNLDRTEKRYLLEKLNLRKASSLSPRTPSMETSTVRYENTPPKLSHISFQFSEELNLPTTPPSPKVTLDSKESTISPKVCTPPKKLNFLGVYDLPKTPESAHVTYNTPITKTVYPCKTPEKFSALELPETPKTPKALPTSQEIFTPLDLEEFNDLCKLLRQATVIKSKDIFEMYKYFGKMNNNFEVLSSENSVVQRLVQFEGFLQFYLPVLTKSALSYKTKLRIRDNVRNYVKDRKSKNLKYTNLNIERVVKTLENLYQLEDNREMVENVLEGLLSSGYFLGDYCSATSTLKVFVARYYIKNRDTSSRTIDLQDNSDLLAKAKSLKNQCLQDKRRESEVRFNSILKRLRSKN